MKKWFRLNDGSNLWNKNYTIMTLGSVVSYMGDATVSFVLGILVLEYSNSVFFYGLYRATYNMARILSPVLAGAILDKLPRQKVIYTLDFASCFIYFIVWLLLGNGSLNYFGIFVIAIILGIFDCCYTVAFDSLYPSLVKPELLHKAYSVYSMLDTCSGISVPVAALLCTYVDYGVIFFMAAVLYLIAAFAETIPKIDESHIEKTEKIASLKDSVRSFKEGISYLNTQKAVLILAVITMLRGFTTSMDNTLLLPFCRGKWTENSYLLYILILSFSSSGYFMGGFINSRMKIPEKKHYFLFTCLTAAVAVLGGIYYFIPLIPIIISQYLCGLFANTTYTMRMAAILSTISPNQRARYSGITTSMNNFGYTAGCLLAGAIAEFVPIPYINVTAYSLFGIVSVYLLLSYRKPIKELFERNSVRKEE